MKFEDKTMNSFDRDEIPSTKIEAAVSTIVDRIETACSICALEESGLEQIAFPLMCCGNIKDNSEDPDYIWVGTITIPKDINDFNDNFKQKVFDGFESMLAHIKESLFKEDE